MEDQVAEGKENTSEKSYGTSIRLPDELRKYLRREAFERGEEGGKEPAFGDLLLEAWRGYTEARNGIRALGDASSPIILTLPEMFSKYADALIKQCTQLGIEPPIIRWTPKSEGRPVVELFDVEDYIARSGDDIDEEERAELLSDVSRFRTAGKPLSPADRDLSLSVVGILQDGGPKAEFLRKYLESFRLVAPSLDLPVEDQRVLAALTRLMEEGDAAARASVVPFIQNWASRNPREGSDGGGAETTKVGSKHKGKRRAG
jgi:hypothetical protein